jgi:DNA-binding protein YbaB
MIPRRKLQELKGTDELANMLMSGEANVKWVPIGPKFSDVDSELAETLHELFLTGLGAVEEKIEKQNTKIAEESIDSVVDGLYEMLRGNDDK